MKLIFGLGNPGSEYENNRHNVGFQFVDYIYAHSTVQKEWQTDKYVHSLISKVEIGDQPFILAKPQTFMNVSGDALKRIVIRESLLPNDVYVAHDDLDIHFGEFKISKGKGPKLHNGINSIEDHWKTAEFWRIRIGIENRNGVPIPGVEYVLQNFSKEERGGLAGIFERIFTAFQTAT